MTLPTIMNSLARLSRVAGPSVVAFLLLFQVARADVDQNAAFTASARTIAVGPPMVVELRIVAVTPMASLRAHAGRGIATLAGCDLGELAVGETRLCRITLTGVPEEKYLSVKLVSERAAATAGEPAQMDFEVLTFRNSAHNAAQRRVAPQSTLRAR